MKLPIRKKELWFAVLAVLAVEAANLLCYKPALETWRFFTLENALIHTFSISVLLSVFRLRKRWTIPLCLTVCVMSFVTSDFETSDGDGWYDFAWAGNQLMQACPYWGEVSRVQEGEKTLKEVEKYLGGRVDGAVKWTWVGQHEPKEDYYVASIGLALLAAKRGKAFAMCVVAVFVTVFALLWCGAHILLRGVFRTCGIWMVWFLAAPFLPIALGFGNGCAFEMFIPSVTLPNLACVRFVFWMVLVGCFGLSRKTVSWKLAE